jgi:superfamily II DNA or RNA helicase
MRGFREVDRGIMSNARCLTEGVDVPAVDVVAFLSPRKSKVDIVQAAGRAMRTTPGKETGYILLPLFVETQQDETIEEALARTDFAELQRIIDATTPLGKDTYLVTEFGKAFTVNGFGNRFRKWCDEAGLPHCSAHGLRKASSARLAELGASDREIMAITGHQTAKEVDRYTKGVRQKKLAASAMEKWEREGYK